MPEDEELRSNNILSLEPLNSLRSKESSIASENQEISFGESDTESPTLNNPIIIDDQPSFQDPSPSVFTTEGRKN